jgi:hypothetical protein
MKIIVKLSTFIAVICLACAVLAQSADVVAKPLTDSDITMLRKDIQNSKDGIITENMKFSKPESDAFWPLYKQYSGEQHAIAETRLAILTEYAQNLDKMSDGKAHELTARIMKVDEDSLALRRKYLPKFESALGETRAAKFFQIDSRMSALVNLQLASEAPLIP